VSIRKSDPEPLAKLMNELADSVLELSEEESMAEEREAGGDPIHEATRVLALLHPDPIEKTTRMLARPRPIRVVIADDHPIFRDGLRRLLEAEGDIKVLGEASDGADAVKLARQFKPDILLLDLAMPRHPGLEALRELSVPTNATPVRVILLTAAAEKSQIVEALQLGARGVVLKDSATQLLFKAIQTVMAGEYWVGRESVSNLVQYLRTLMQSTHDEARQKRFGLSPRELEIVSAVVAGYSNKEIAGYFKISEDTVKHHLSNIFDKLGVSTRLELALFAVNQALPITQVT
jgi:two-component system, NarL family, nitrate/nitrite response regulator NarL